MIAPSSLSMPALYHGPITKAGNGHARSMLVQAAHSVARHPGPLGYFFRKLSKRKKYNVAVVATARKLVVIAWHMLTRNEPYRYASPQCTAVKLARLRVSATGKRRPSGSRSGVRNVSRLPEGGLTATIKSLPRICQEEGLPAPQQLSSGELRTVEQSGTSDYVASTRQDQVLPRRKRPRKTGQPSSSTKATS
jgi:transposase